MNADHERLMKRVNRVERLAKTAEAKIVYPLTPYSGDIRISWRDYMWERPTLRKAETLLRHLNRALVLTFLLLGTAFIANAQTDCPADKVCISRDAALKAVKDSETVKAQTVEIDALIKANADTKDLLNKMRIEFAEKAGENTALKQNAVSDRAIIDFLLKNVKPKKIGLIVF